MDDNIKRGLQENGWMGRRLKSSGSRKGLVAASCEHGIQNSGFIKFEKSIHLFRKQKLLKNVCIPWSSLDR